MAYRGGGERGGRGGGGRGGRGGPPRGDSSGRGSPDFRGRGAPRGGFGGGGGGGREQGGIFGLGRPANIDKRLLDTSQDDLVNSLKTIKLQSNDLPLRPDFGTQGQVIKLRTNFFPVKVPKGPLYEYDVSISPTAGTAIRRLKRRIYQLAEQSPEWSSYGLKGVVAHDHSTKLIAARKLPQPLSIRVPFYDENDPPPKPGTGKEYTLTFEYAQDIETQSLVNYLQGNLQYRGYDIMPVISALNIVLAAHPNRSGGGGVMVGRNRFFFRNAARPMDLGGGLEAWKGFYSSVRPSHKELLVNVNACTTAFYTPGNLAEAMVKFEQSSFGARAGAFVRGVRVQTTHLKYKKTIKGVFSKNARQYSFDSGVHGKVTIEEYFKRQYNVTLKRPDLPLVSVGGLKDSYLPPEVCTILPDQPFRGKLTDEHTAAMITFAAKPPNINAEFIEGPGLSELGFRSTAAPLGEFGVSIGTEMALVPGRILRAPGIVYGQGAPKVDNERASWNLRNVKFKKGGFLRNWVVMVIQDGGHNDFTRPDDPLLVSTLNGFMAMCRASGMQVDPKLPQIVPARLPPKRREDPTRKEAMKVLETAIKSVRPKPVLVLVLLSNGDKLVYSRIKYLFDVLLDVASVCVHSTKLTKENGQPQYFANVALKVNMKMGGVNHDLDPSNMAWLKKTPTMLVGIDVTHPGPGSCKGTPSIAAVVGSCDNFYGQYPASMECQASKQEIVERLDKMMHERLSHFKARNNILPERVLVYRDGVSEGQFSIVVERELPAIKAAFALFNVPGKPYKPKLTIVICGKRHHTRFYPVEAAHGDKNGNPRPGTVVDRGVTAVYNFDFFLQAHGGLQGTTKPTHYYVVYDEIKFKADELQGLTNSVSYMFARATKAVSLVSPAYYADLACERGRCYLQGLLSGISEDSTTVTGLSDPEKEQRIYKEGLKLWSGGVNGAALKDTMYYL